jgi:hypothetical protein
VKDLSLEEEIIKFKFWGFKNQEYLKNSEKILLQILDEKNIFKKSLYLQNF